MPPPNNPFLIFTSATLLIAVIDSLSILSDVRIVIFTPLSCNALSLGNACLTNSTPTSGNVIITSSLQLSTISKIFAVMFTAPDKTQISGLSLVPLFSYSGTNSFKIIF